MKLMTMKQYMKMSKPALIRKITKTLRVMPKIKLARLCYNITKSKLPRLKQKKFGPWKSKEEFYKSEIAYRKKLPKDITKHIGLGGVPMRATQPYRKKRKFSRKQLAAQRLFAKRARAGTLKRRRR